MEDDLIIGPEGEEEIDFMAYSDLDYITAAHAALSSVEGANPMTMEDQKRVRRITRKALAIIDHCLGEMYNELFDDKSED